jgi:hypothetical protein
MNKQIFVTFCCIVTFIENRTVYEIMWKNIAERNRAQMSILRMRIACWIPKATDTHSENVIIIAFPRQRWLQERASMLRYAYIDSLVDPYPANVENMVSS